MDRDANPDPAAAPQTDDRILVARSQRGDTTAYEELVRRHQRRVYGLVYNMTGNKDRKSVV